MRLQDCGAWYDEKFESRLPQSGWGVCNGYARRFYRNPGVTLSDPDAGKVMTQLMHRLIWELEYGLPVPVMLDHINGNRLDNRLENLRDASYLLNAANLHCKINGCWPSKYGKFLSSIQHNGTTYHLGTFDTEAEAKAVYDKNFQIRLTHLELGLPGEPPFDLSFRKARGNKVDRQRVIGLFAEGCSPDEIAQKLEVHPKTIKNCYKDLGLPWPKGKVGRPRKSVPF